MNVDYPAFIEIKHKNIEHEDITTTIQKYDYEQISDVHIHRSYHEYARLTLVYHGGTDVEHEQIIDCIEDCEVMRVYKLLTEVMA